MDETQSLTNSENCMNSIPEKENLNNAHIYENNQKSNPEPDSTNSKIPEMTTKTVQEISTRIEEVFAKLQRNLEHNTRVFQEKSQGLLSKIDQAEEQLRKVLSQIENSVRGGSGSSSSDQNSNKGETDSSSEVIVATESIALSEETKLEADETTENQ